MTVSAVVRVDGACRGNPGESGLGVVVEVPGKEPVEVYEYLGHTTNNVAEYKALLRGLAEAEALGAAEVVLYSDSELMVRQMNGVYRVKAAHLLPFFEEAKSRAKRFRSARILHVRRELNAHADALANKAIDARRG